MLFEAEGFTSVASRRIRQQTSSSIAEFAARTSRRADTSLALLADHEFAQGQAELETAAARETQPSPVFETLDLLVLQRRDR
jgi:hypothetical protein